MRLYSNNIEDNSIEPLVLGISIHVHEPTEDVHDSIMIRIYAYSVHFLYSLNVSQQSRSSFSFTF